jgi:hypothetical protein
LTSAPGPWSSNLGDPTQVDLGATQVDLGATQVGDLTQVGLGTRPLVLQPVPAGAT